MNLVRHMAGGLAAAWHFLRLDPDAKRFLDPRPRGLWLSFSALLLALPLYAAILWLDARAGGIARAAAAPLTMLIPAYGAGWLLFIALAGLIARRLGVLANLVPFLIALHWARVVALALIAFPILLIAGEVIDAGPGKGLLFAVYGYVGFYKWYVTQATLRTSPAASVGIVALEVVVFFGLEIGAAALYLAAS